MTGPWRWSRTAATEPPDDAWVMCSDGHEWATDGALAMALRGTRGPEVVDVRDGVVVEVRDA